MPSSYSRNIQGYPKYSKSIQGIFQEYSRIFKDIQGNISRISNNIQGYLRIQDSMVPDTSLSSGCWVHRALSWVGWRAVKGRLILRDKMKYCAASLILANHKIHRVRRNHFVLSFSTRPCWTYWQHRGPGSSTAVLLDGEVEVVLQWK